MSTLLRTPPLSLRLFPSLTALVLVLIGTSSTGAQAPSLATFSNELQALVQRVGPSVVQINVSGYAVAEAAGSGTADTLLERQRSTGSGVIVDAGGYVITNYHVAGRAAPRPWNRSPAMLPIARIGIQGVRYRGVVSTRR